MKNENAKHTPGPWMVKGNNTAVWSGGKFITRTEYDAYSNCVNSKNEAEANAHLIATAPELLAALELALTTLSSVACNESDEIDNVKTEIANAINKAKGE